MEPVLLLITEDITLESDFKRLHEMENYKMKMLASISHEVNKLKTNLFIKFFYFLFLSL